jgi:glutaredoxin
MKSTIILIVGLMLISTSLVVAIPAPPTPDTIDRLYTHDILGEDGTATWCGYCKYAHGALKNIYAGGWHPFYYICLVDDRNTHAAQRIDELGLTGFPTVFFDGGYRSNVGAGSIPSAQAAYNTSIVACGNRPVPSVELVIDVDWYGNAKMNVTATVYNNGTGSYSARLRVYVCEMISSLGWYDTAGHLYTFPFLDYAFNQQITVSSGSIWTSTYYWDGALHNSGMGQNFGSVAKDNTMVIGAIFNSGTNYVDDTFGYRVGTNQPPNTPSNPVPSSGSTDVGLEQNLGWTGGDPDWFDTVTYDVYFEANDPTPDVLVADDITTTNFDPGTLSFTTTYYWQIVAQDNNGAISTGPVWYFTTRGNTAPYVPSSPDPNDSETDVYINADLDWIGGDPENDPVTYDVYFGTTSPPIKLASNVTTSDYDPGILNFDTQYYWKIISWDSFGETTPGSIWSFTTEINQPPNTPTDPYPEDGAIEVNTETDLEWTGDDPNPGDSLTYDVFFGTSNPPPLVKQNQTFTQYNPGSMELDTTYYWKVITWDSQDESAVGSIWSFTTASAPNVAPTIPDITGKTNIKVNTEYEYTFVSTDDNDDDIYIYVTWGDGTTSDWIGPYSSGESVVLTHTWENKGDFTIQAKAKDPFDAESGWGNLEISVPTSQSSQPIVFTFGLFPYESEGRINFWRGSWQDISANEFQGYCGKIFLFGKVI